MPDDPLEAIQLRIVERQAPHKELKQPSRRAAARAATAGSHGDQERTRHRRPRREAVTGWPGPAQGEAEAALPEMALIPDGPPRRTPTTSGASSFRRPILVNVGCGPMGSGQVPAMFDSWRQLRVDVDRRRRPGCARQRDRPLGHSRADSPMRSGRPIASSISFCIRCLRRCPNSAASSRMTASSASSCRICRRSRNYIVADRLRRGDL